MVGCKGQTCLSRISGSMNFCPNLSTAGRIRWWFIRYNIKTGINRHKIAFKTSSFGLKLPISMYAAGRFCCSSNSAMTRLFSASSVEIYNRCSFSQTMCLQSKVYPTVVMKKARVDNDRCVGGSD